MIDKELSEEIKNSLTLEQVFEFLQAFGGNPIIQNGMIISQTICHGGDSHKLYYYDNSHLFKCYTQCSNHIFDIYELFIKIQKQNDIEVILPKAVLFIAKYFNISIEDKIEKNDSNDLQDWKILKNYEKTIEETQNKIIEYKIFDEKILKYLPAPRIKPWEDEHISREAMAAAQIKYNPISQGIVIPHYDINGKLIGIRERTLILENEIFGKYKPAILNNKMYNHPLGFNLYNLNLSKDNIKQIKKVIVFESEKATLLYKSYFGEDNDISVAVCGSNLLIHQINLLLPLGVEEIIIAFDKQFKEIGDQDWENWTKKLKEIHKKYGSYIQLSFMFDKENLLEYKSSPIDEGKEKFLTLFKKRVVL